MMLPPWIPFLVAVWVIAFGIMRIRIAIKKSKENEDDDRPNFRKGGYYARSSRSHMIYGIAYLLLGGYCISMGLGYHFNFTSGCVTEAQETPKTMGGVPVDNVDVKSSAPSHGK